MPTRLTVQVVHESGLQMTATNGVHSVTTDYPLQPGDAGAGLKPMELLLASLGACGGSVVASLLKRAGQPMAGVEVNVRGERRDEHPTIFTGITVEFVIRGAGVETAAIERAIAAADGRLCPVWAMLKPAVPISTSYRVEAHGTQHTALGT
jgi:putative redox protein